MGGRLDLATRTPAVGRGRGPSRAHTALFGDGTMTYDILCRKPNYRQIEIEQVDL